MVFSCSGHLCLDGATIHEGRDSFMNIHEYQAKALLRDFGAPVSDGRIVM